MNIYFLCTNPNTNMTMMNKKNNQSMLSCLKMAMQRLRLLLSSTVVRSWHISAVIRRASPSRRHLSFNNRPGLILCSDEAGTDGSGSGSSRRLQRTINFPSEDDDIDRRAEMFIANFKRQLQMERQISLQLRYRRGNSFESISP